LRNPEEWTVDFLATDVNTEFIDAALVGRYREWSFRKVGDFWRTKYFRPEGDEWRVAGKVRGMVRFATANLLDERDNVVAAGPAPFDLIVCRNVLIYFDDESIARVGALFRKYLAPGGWYVGGHVEPVVFDDGFEPVSFPGAILYRKLLPEEVSSRAKRRPAEEPRRRPAPERRAPTNELEKADRLVAAGDDGRALVELAALTEKRHDPEVYWRMGRVLGNLGRYEEGLEWCRKAAELNQRNPFPYYISALILEEMGRNEESFENLRRSLFVDKGFVLGHFSMANYYRWREDDERAARSYRNVLRLLDGREDGEHIAGDGLTVGRLREIVNQIL
jgi:chemotaxis protein methyltransferase CheR